MSSKTRRTSSPTDLSVNAQFDRLPRIKSKLEWGADGALYHTEWKHDAYTGLTLKRTTRV